MPSSPHLRFADYGLFVVLSVMWGMSFVAIRRLDSELSFVDLTLLRWFIAAAGYLTLLPFLGKAKISFQRSDLPRLLFIGFLNVAAYHLSLNYAEVTVSAGLAGLLIAVAPVFSVLLAVVFLGEKVGARLVLALVLAVSGAVILSAGDLSALVGISGPLAAVLAAASYAMFSVFSKPLVEKYGALRLAIWAGLMGTVMILPLVSGSLITDVYRLTLTGWGALVYLSLVSTVIGYSIFFTLVGRGRVSRLTIQLYLIPVVSLVGGALLLGETITMITLVGGAATLLAVWLATTKGKRA